MNRREWCRFSELPGLLRGKSGWYEIRFGRMYLKVGIASNLLRRLRQHGKSSQHRLVSPMPGPWVHPNQVVSKGPILAKHLYFDRGITTRYNLKTQEGRAQFLEERCQLRYTLTTTDSAARRMEKRLEQSGKYRYVGRVRVR